MAQSLVSKAIDQALALAMTVAPNHAVQQRFVELLHEVQRQRETQDRQLEILVAAVLTGIQFGNWPGDTLSEQQQKDQQLDLQRPDRFSTDENP